MTRLILDVMGGDHAPHAILLGAQRALPELAQSQEGAELILLGGGAEIRKLLAARKYRELNAALQATGADLPGCRVSVVHAPETIDMHDSIRAVRSKPNASINVGCKLAAESYAESKKTGAAPAGFVSAGHSGAMMASAL